MNFYRQVHNVCSMKLDYSMWYLVYWLPRIYIHHFAFDSLSVELNSDYFEWYQAPVSVCDHWNAKWVPDSIADSRLYDSPNRDLGLLVAFANWAYQRRAADLRLAETVRRALVRLICLNWLFCVCMEFEKRKGFND